MGMRYITALSSVILLILVSGCQESVPVCPTATGTPQYLVIQPDELATTTPSSVPFQVDIGGKSMQVDKVVAGPLCNDTWSGTVYVGCDVQVYAWQEEPTFLKNLI